MILHYMIRMVVAWNTKMGNGLASGCIRME